MTSDFFKKEIPGFYAGFPASWALTGALPQFLQDRNLTYFGRWGIASLGKWYICWNLNDELNCSKRKRGLGRAAFQARKKLWGGPEASGKPKRSAFREFKVSHASGTEWRKEGSKRTEKVGQGEILYSFADSVVNLELRRPKTHWDTTLRPLPEQNICA